MLMVTDVHDIIKRHQAQIITSLKDPDIRLNLRVLHFSNVFYFFMLFLMHMSAAVFFFVSFWVFHVNDYKEDGILATDVDQMHAQCIEYHMFMRIKLLNARPKCQLLLFKA